MATNLAQSAPVLLARTSHLISGAGVIFKGDSLASQTMPQRLEKVT